MIAGQLLQASRNCNVVSKPSGEGRYFLGKLSKNELLLCIAGNCFWANRRGISPLCFVKVLTRHGPGFVLLKSTEDICDEDDETSSVSF